MCVPRTLTNVYQVFMFCQHICVFFLQFLCLWVLSECACAIVFVLACLVIVFVIIVFKCICICVCVYLCDCFCPLSPNSHWLSFLYATSLCRVQITKLFTEKTCNCVPEHTSTQAHTYRKEKWTRAQLQSQDPRLSRVQITKHSQSRAKSAITKSQNRLRNLLHPHNSCLLPAVSNVLDGMLKKSRMENIFEEELLQVVLRMSCVASSFSSRSGLGFTHAVCTVDTKRTGRTKVTLLVRSPSLHL